MSNIDTEKNVYVIVHGQKQLFETVKSRLGDIGLKTEKLVLADMNKPGNEGDYVAMLWPPMGPTEIILSEIIDFNGPERTRYGGLGNFKSKRITAYPFQLRARITPFTFSISMGKLRIINFGKFIFFWCYYVSNHY